MGELEKVLPPYCLRLFPKRVAKTCFSSKINLYSQINRIVPNSIVVLLCLDCTGTTSVLGGSVWVCAAVVVDFGGSLFLAAGECCTVWLSTPIIAINNTTNTSHHIPIITIVVLGMVLLRLFIRQIDLKPPVCL